MDGQTLLRMMSQLLAESPGSAWLDVKLSYDCLYRAAIATADRINYPTSSQDITTVAETSSYVLNPDYLKQYLQDNFNRYFVKYVTSTYTVFVYPASYDSIVLANNTTSVDIPTAYCINDATPLVQKTGTATATGTLAATYTLFGKALGESALTDSAADFSTVKVGDLVHNTTDASHGVVVATSSSTSVVCALFDGTNNYFSSGDAYIINPQKRFQIIVDPLSKTAGYTITIPYIQKPAPVYSYYRRYNFPSGYEDVLTHYAAWVYKYRDRQPNMADPWYGHWDVRVRQLAQNVNQGMDRVGRIRVNFIKRAYRDRSIR